VATGRKGGEKKTFAPKVSKGLEGEHKGAKKTSSLKERGGRVRKWNWRRIIKTKTTILEK